MHRPQAAPTQTGIDMTEVLICDQTAADGQAREISIRFPSESITVEELIRSRVYEDVQDANLKSRQGDTGQTQPAAVEPSEAERALNGPGTATPKPIEWARQFQRAIEAFERNQILILVDERRVMELDEKIELSSDTEIRFVRLTMLMGG